MFNVMKNKAKSTKAIVFYILFFILIVCIVSIKVFSVQVYSAEQIKEKLIGEKINLKGEDLELTRENLLDVKIISRKTEKKEKDIVKVKLKIDTSELVEDIDTTVNFIYRYGNWDYDGVCVENMFNVTEYEDVKKYLNNYFKERGIQVEDKLEIVSPLIKKTSNIKLSDESIFSGKEFYIDITLFNGVCSQNCKVKGIIECNKDKLEVKDITIDSKSNIYEEKDEDFKVIEKLVWEEIEREGVFKLKKAAKYKEVYLKSDEKSIESLEIKDCKIREDYSIRAEVSGKVYLQKYKENFLFTGLVSISGKLSEGRRKNAKDIVIYDVPFN